MIFVPQYWQKPKSLLSSSVILALQFGQLHALIVIPPVYYFNKFADSIPANTDIYQLILGGNHDKGFLKFGLDPLEAISRRREDLIGVGYDYRTIELGNKNNKILLHHPNRRFEEDELYNSWNIIPNGNFALTDSSVIYTFNPYEIAPYCYGIINIELKLEN